jgi:hypothetical protein
LRNDVVVEGLDALAVPAHEPLGQQGTILPLPLRRQAEEVADHIIPP